MKKALILVTLFLLLPSPLFAQEVIKGNVEWNEDKARQTALRHIERQVDVQFFKSKDEHYFENVKLREQNPNLKFANRQVTFFENGEYSVVYEGENMVHYYQPDGDLFKVSVCSKPFGDESDYPRRCMEYSYPEGKFQTVSMDVSPEESYVFSLDGKLIQHWKDEQGFDPATKTNWTRWNDKESNP